MPSGSSWLNACNENLQPAAWSTSSWSGHDSWCLQKYHYLPKGVIINKYVLSERGRCRWVNSSVGGNKIQMWKTDLESLYFGRIRCHNFTIINSICLNQFMLCQNQTLTDLFPTRMKTKSKLKSIENDKRWKSIFDCTRLIFCKSDFKFNLRIYWRGL